MYRRVLLLLASLASLSSHAVRAETVEELFVRQNAAHLCEASGGEQIVIPETVAERLLTGMPLDLLRRANPSGQPVPALTVHEYIYALTNDEPFGAGPEALTPRAIAAKTKLVEIRMEFSTFLSLGGKEAEGFLVVSTLPSSPLSRDFFLRRGVRIVCVAQTIAQPAPVKKKPLADALSNRLLVRSQVSELALPRDQIAQTKGATFSFTHDSENNKDITIADGVVGWKLLERETTSATVSLIPYLRFRWTSTDPGNEVSYLEPGLTLGAFYVGDRIAATASLSASKIIDESNNSEQANFAASLTPSFRIPLGARNLVLFGGYLPPFGPFSFRPEIQLKAQGRDIESAGTNPLLLGKNSYYGVGIEGTLGIIVVAVPLLQKLYAEIKYTCMENFGVVDVGWFQSTLMYPLLNSDLVTLNLTYVNGRNLETLLQEERFTLGLAFRY